MDLTPHDQAIVDRVVGVLMTKQSAPFLTDQDIRPEDVKDLLSSPVPDLSTLGLHVLTLIQNDPSRKEAPIEFFEQNDTMAGNYAKWMMTERPKEYTGELFRSINPNSVVASRWSSLWKNMPPPLSAAAPAAPIDELTVIVHGTFAASYDWWRPNGTFWLYIDNIYKSRHRSNQLYAGQHPFSWSGGNDHKERVQGSRDFRDWLLQNPHNQLDVIAHSHGGNVCLLATWLGVKIRKLILLGNPIRLEYFPNLRNIAEVHNVFSTGDHIQMPAGTIPNGRGEGRTLGDSQNVFNYRAYDDGHGKNPSHSDLHESATWNANDLHDLL